MKVEKVYIFGAPGTGKTRMGLNLDRRLSIPLISLDKIVYRNGVKMRDLDSYNMLRSQTDGGKWIVEGSYLGWCDFLFRDSDIVVELTAPFSTALWNIIKRLFSESRYPLNSTTRLIIKTLPSYYREEIIGYPRRAGARWVLFGTYKEVEREIETIWMKS